MDPAAATSASNNLLQYGVLGAFAVLMIGAIVFLTRRLLSEMDGRRVDNKEMVDATRAASETASALKGAIELNTRAQIDSNQFRAELTTALEGLEKTVEARSDDLRRLLLERTKAPGGS